MKRYRIRKHSPLDIAIKLMAVCGFVFAVGSVGYDDMMVEMHAHYPLALTALKVLVGFAMIAPWWLLQMAEQDDETSK